jgi:hypothetical protein
VRVNVVMQGSNRLTVMFFLQWISEVMHFCAGLPIILVGCKKDLRRDPRVIEELRKTSQRPVTPEEVSERQPPSVSYLKLFMQPLTPPLTGDGCRFEDWC